MTLLTYKHGYINLDNVEDIKINKSQYANGNYIEVHMISGKNITINEGELHRPFDETIKMLDAISTRTINILSTHIPSYL